MNQAARQTQIVQVWQTRSPRVRARLRNWITEQATVVHMSNDDPDDRWMRQRGRATTHTTSYFSYGGLIMLPLYR